MPDRQSAEPDPVPEGRTGRGGILLALTRVWLPLVIALAGVIAVVVGHGRTALAGAGVGLLIIGVIVWMINWMFRLSVESNRDREIEEEAREYFDRHGRWPDEAP